MGGTIREDFIVAHVKEMCSFCRGHVDGGSTVYRGPDISSSPLSLYKSLSSDSSLSGMLSLSRDAVGSLSWRGGGEDGPFSRGSLSQVSRYSPSVLLARQCGHSSSSLVSLSSSRHLSNLLGEAESPRQSLSNARPSLSILLSSIILVPKPPLGCQGHPPRAKVEPGIKIEPGSRTASAPVTSLTLCEPCYNEEQGRMSFLTLCQGNHYQFDTLRRAKHSSMMVLYHLHNPQAAAFPTSCSVCQKEVEPGTGFRCTVCPDFDICANCKHTSGHPHPLTKEVGPGTGFRCYVCPDFDICANCKHTSGHPHPLTAHVRQVNETRTRLTDKELHERKEQLQCTKALLAHVRKVDETRIRLTDKERRKNDEQMQCTMALLAHVRKVDETRIRLTDKERRERDEQMQRTMALLAHVRKVDETRTRLTDKERRERDEQMQRTMALLVHACSCNNPQCSSNSCRKIRQLFQHAVQCQLKALGGCQSCKKMWYLLNLHAKGCSKHDCPIPQCHQLKELRRKQTARQEEQRRLSYQNMLRQQQKAIASEKKQVRG
eukprot:gene8175-1431_t